MTNKKKTTRKRKQTTKRTAAQQRPPRSPKKTNWVDKKAKSNDWHTPEHVLDLVREYFGGPIPLDPFTSKDNPTGAVRFFTPKENGLVQDWAGAGAFVNPPYSCLDPTTRKRRYPIRDAIRKTHEEAQAGSEVIALLPCGARFSTGYWQDHALVEELTAVCFVRGRIKFINAATGKPAKRNNYDSMIYGFNVDPVRFCQVFEGLGRVFATSFSTSRDDGEFEGVASALESAAASVRDLAARDLGHISLSITDERRQARFAALRARADELDRCADSASSEEPHLLDQVIGVLDDLPTLVP